MQSFYYVLQFNVLAMEEKNRSLSVSSSLNQLLAYFPQLLYHYIVSNVEHHSHFFHYWYYLTPRFVIIDIIKFSVYSHHLSQTHIISTVITNSHQKENNELECPIITTLLINTKITFGMYTTRYINQVKRGLHRNPYLRKFTSIYRFTGGKLACGTYAY